MMVNKQELPLDGSVNAKISMVKAESYHLGSNLPSALYEPQNVEAMAASMSKGIVSLEVKIQSEEVPVAFGLDQGDGAVAVVKDDRITMRRLGLFIKIHEVEGMSFEHDTMVFAPILQLLVKSNNGRIAGINTLSIVGRPVTQLEDGSDKLAGVERVPSAFRPHKHSSSIAKWLASMFPSARQEAHLPKMHYGLAAGPPMSRFRKGHPLAPEHSRHHHAHHRHGSCFGRRFKHGLKFVGQSLATFFLDTRVGVICLVSVSFLTAFYLGKAIGFLLANMINACFGSKKPEEFDDEKVYLVVEEGEIPPTYEDVRMASPLFDAEQEMKDEKR